MFLGPSWTHWNDLAGGTKSDEAIESALAQQRRLVTMLETLVRCNQAKAKVKPSDLRKCKEVFGKALVGKDKRAERMRMIEKVEAELFRTIERINDLTEEERK